MKRVELTETRNNFSDLVDQVRQGETILILDRGVPVARLASVFDSETASEGRLARLERQGLVRRGENKKLRKIFGERPPRPESGASAVDALLDERRSGKASW